jgi:hypothetical protein
MIGLPLAAAVLVAGLGVLLAGRHVPAGRLRRGLTALAGWVLIAGAGLFAARSLLVVQPGEGVVLSTLGAVEPRVHLPGVHLVNPLSDRVSLDLSAGRISATGAAALIERTVDGVMVEVSLEALWQAAPAAVSALWVRLGPPHSWQPVVEASLIAAARDEIRISSPTRSLESLADGIARRAEATLALAAVQAGIDVTPAAFALGPVRVTAFREVVPSWWAVPLGSQGPEPVARSPETNGRLTAPGG